MRPLAELLFIVPAMGIPIFVLAGLVFGVAARLAGIGTAKPLPRPRTTRDVTT